VTRFQLCTISSENVIFVGTWYWYRDW